MSIHAYCVLSNHFHLVLTDPFARLPAFEQYLDSLIARAINATLGRWEAFWAPSSYSAVALASPTDIVEKTAYVLANPVAAGLVRHGHDWPGLWSAPDLVAGSPVVAPRPATFFSARGSMPESCELAICVPPGFDSAITFRDRIVEALTTLEARVEKEVARTGRTFLGPRKILTQKHAGHPTTGEPRRELNPRVAARDKWRRVETLTRLLDFIARYRAAWRARRAGDAGALFPAGTYLMRVVHGVPCAGV